MTKFDAATAADPLDFDFKPYADVKGTVPEPSDDQVATFYGKMGRQFEDTLPAERLEGVDLTDPYDVGRLVMSLTEDEHRGMYDFLLDLHADVCSGTPGREAIEALPYRLRRAWYGCVQGWLRPESLRPATND